MHAEAGLDGKEALAMVGDDEEKLHPDRRAIGASDIFFTEAVNDGRKARNGLSQAEPQFKLN
jgi:hypothetical protein